MDDLTRPTLAQLTGVYTIDPAHTRIRFVARHAMVTKVRGAFNEFEGTAVLDGDNPANSTAMVTIKAASIDTRNAQRDEHLRANDFLAMDSYPEITFALPPSARLVTLRTEPLGPCPGPIGNHRAEHYGAGRRTCGTRTTPAGRSPPRLA